jgi:hypothetical protein
MKSLALKKQADEKRRAERKQRHLQDDLRYALKKLPEPLDISLSYEDVSKHICYQCLMSNDLFRPYPNSIICLSSKQSKTTRAGGQLSPNTLSVPRYVSPL